MARKDYPLKARITSVEYKHDNQGRASLESVDVLIRYRSYDVSLLVGVSPQDYLELVNGKNQSFEQGLTRVVNEDVLDILEEERTRRKIENRVIYK